jgi:hypothetical protein
VPKSKAKRDGLGRFTKGQRIPDVDGSVIFHGANVGVASNVVKVDASNPKIAEITTYLDKSRTEANNRYSNLVGQILRLKQVENEALEGIKELSGGKYYDWKQSCITELERVANIAKVQRLELEISTSPYYRINFEGRPIKKESK